MENCYYPFVNLPLPYAYDALEPYIDTKTMRLHHDRHLGAYITNLNKTLESCPRLQKLSLEQLVKNAMRLTDEVQTAVRNNAGGVYNHRFFFEELKNPSEKIHGKLESDIKAQFGDIRVFSEKFKQAALSVFGSGYAWLVYSGGRLRIITTKNQDTPFLCDPNVCPILNIDVWEHAYYLKHYNVRADYIDDFMQVISWEKAEERYLKIIR